MEEGVLSDVLSKHKEALDRLLKLSVYSLLKLLTVGKRKLVID